MSSLSSDVAQDLRLMRKRKYLRIEKLFHAFWFALSMSLATLCIILYVFNMINLQLSLICVIMMIAAGISSYWSYNKADEKYQALKVVS